LFAAGGGRALLVELRVMKQHYHAVMEVPPGAPVTEVAMRYDVRRLRQEYSSSCTIPARLGPWPHPMEFPNANQGTDNRK